MLSLIKTEQLIFMSDRSDDYQLQPFDGYAAYVAGIRNFSNKAHAAFINDKQVRICGTMPHALIHQFNGDIVATYNAYIKLDKKNVIMLIDFDNDVLQTLALLKPYFANIHGVRIDTSKSVVDKCLTSLPNAKELYGVNDLLIKKVREFLNQNNGQHIKIVISSGLDYGQVSLLLRQKAPVDSYGIGSSLTSLTLHFTADLVKRNNKLLAKFGRHYMSEAGMQLYVSK